MIRVCYYKGCGIVYGEKEPLSDRRITHGLCPKHLKISLKQIRSEMRRSSMVMNGNEAPPRADRERFPGKDGRPGRPGYSVAKRDQEQREFKLR